MSGSERVGDLSDYKLKSFWESSQEERSPKSVDVWQAKRRQAQTDLFWLCGLLGYALTERAHLDICESFFVKKNPDIPLDDLSGEKQDRLLFAPRDSYKSSIANADDVQWVVCYSNIKIGIQSSKIERSAGFVEEIKSFFLAPENTDGDFILSRFQVLFPEHAAPYRSRGGNGEFITPARTKFSKEPTIQALSIEESKASIHFHIGRNDDVISEGNSGPDSTPEARANVGKKLIESRNLFDTILYIGTPQFTDDGYAMLQENLGDSLLVMQKPGWEIKDASANKPENDLTEGDFNLLFPFDARGKAKLTYKVLRGYQRANPESFRSQQLCQLTAQKRVHITDAMVRAHSLPGGYHSFESTPAISTWDLGYALDNRDFSVGSAGYQDSIKGVVLLDAVRGRWKKEDLCRLMAEQAARLRIHTIYIEDSQGARWLDDDIKKALGSLGAVTTEVVYFAIDVQPDAKQKRFESIFKGLKADQFWLSSDVPKAQIDFIAHELSRFKYGTARQRDDVSDSLAHLIAKLQEPVTVKLKEAPASQAQLILAEKMLRQMVYPDSEEKASPFWNVGDPTRFPKPEAEPEPLKEFDGQPVFQSAEHYFHQVTS